MALPVAVGAASRAGDGRLLLVPLPQGLTVLNKTSWDPAGSSAMSPLEDRDSIHKAIYMSMRIEDLDSM